MTVKIVSPDNLERYAQGINGKFAGVVKLTDNQTVAGVKTFSSSPIVPTEDAGDNTQKTASTGFVQNAVSSQAVKFDSVQTLTDAQKEQARTNIDAPANSDVVHLIGNESVSGVKTFADSPIVPTADEADYSQKSANTAFVQTRIRKTADELQKQINALEGVVLTATENSAVAYSKAIPTSANLFKYAAIRNYGGRSIVWNQLCNSYTTPQTISGITFTPNADGSWTLNGTASADAIKVICPSVAIPAGHKLLVCGCPTGGSVSTYKVNTRFGQINDYGSGAIGNYASDTETGVFLTVFSGVTVDNLVFRPQLFDLTLMFGAGNEPSTVEEFRAIFPDDYYAYNEGEILNAPVNKIVSRGKNLADNSKWVIGNYTNKTTLVPNATVRSLLIDLPPGTYTISGVNTLGASLGFYVATLTDTSRKNVFSTSSANFSNRTFTITEQAQVVQFNADSSWPADFSNLQLTQVEEGSTATAYAPYFETEKAIPAAILALPGYGWSAGSAKNWIDWENKVYHQEVGQIDLGDLNWEYNTNDDTPKFSSTDLASVIKRPATYNTTPTWLLVSRAYTVAAWVPVFSVAGSFGYITEAVNGMLAMTDSSYTDATAFKMAMAGVKLNYEMATPIETDISALIDDNAIEVESGGSLTFENTNGDSYRIPVPSSVVTMEKP